MDNTFAFTRNEQNNSSGIGAFSKYIKNNGFFDLLKITILGIARISIIFTYLYFVNKASTRGYFLRKATQNYNAATFQFEILKTELLSCKQKNREQMHSNRNNNEVVKINTEVVRIPQENNITFNPK